jgi:hypothetical protein
LEGCFFLHNPKAGGTSIRDQLARWFGPAEVAPTLNVLPDVYGRNAPLQLPGGYRYYAGHYGFDDYRAVSAKHLLITNFRHPTSRILSLYNYFRNAVPDSAELRGSDEYYAVRFARRASFDAFIASEDPRVSTYTHNHHFRQLAGSGWSLDLRASLEDVCDRIDRLDWYYVCEYPQLSTLWGRQALGLPNLDIGRSNVTPQDARVVQGGEALDEATRALLLIRNHYDLAIYNHAVRRFLQIVATMGRTPDLSRPAESDGDRLAQHAADRLDASAAA